MLKYGAQIADGLEKAHEAGIVHRDLKPGNIMLTTTGAKLLDFGLAKPAAALEGGVTLTAAAEPTTPVTQEGTIVGTFQYMSPEQVEGKEVDGRSDIFSLGAVLYEMLTGQRAFAGKSQLSVASAILEKEPEAISAIKPMTPHALEHAVKKCLAKLPEERWQSASDLASELRWIAEDHSRFAPHSASPAKSLWKTFLWTVTATALVTAAIGAVVFRRERLPAHYTNVSHRDGSLLGARFSHDGQTIVYGGRWERETAQIYIARVGSPESRPLGISSAEVAAISPSDELAIFLGCEENFFLNCGGTLATVSLAGGSPRTLAEHVAQVDWHPDGKRMVITVGSADGPRLEFPPGHVLYQEKAGWFGHPRFSPDGSMIAFENHPIAANDDGEVDLIDLNGKRNVLFRSSSVEGLAWRPDGKELWFAGTKTAGWADTVFAVTPSGKERIVLTSPSIRLHDISKDGRVLLSHETWLQPMEGLFPGDRSEHPYSWLDSTAPTALSVDGRLISLYEFGEVYYHDYLAYYRPTDGSPAVRLGEGTAAISPDGKWILLGPTHESVSRPLQVQPVGPGQPRDLPTPGLVAFDNFGWSDNSRQIVYEAQTGQGDWNVYTQLVTSGPPVLLRTRGRKAFPVLSPDGTTAALREEHGGISLYRVGRQPLALKAVTESEYAIRFTSNGKSLLVAEPTGREVVLTLVDLASGRREPWKRVPSEARSYQLFVVTPDLKYYAYPYPKYSSVLYVVENLH
jgi:WD40 repeat protein